MLKTLLMLFVTLALSVAAIAATEVNTADQATLEAIKGLGPVKSKAIVDERTKNGPFKDADDLASRVKGLGKKSVSKLAAAGLTVNGSANPPTGVNALSSLKPKANAPIVIPPSITSPSQPTPASRASSKKTERGTASNSPSAETTAPATASSPKVKKNTKKSQQNQNEAGITAPAP